MWKAFVKTLFLGLPLLIGCSVKKPSSPTWDVNLILPLMNKTYTMPQIAEDEDYLSLIGDKLFFSVRDTIPPCHMNGYLIESAQSEPEKLGLSQINSSIAQSHGLNIPIPPFTFPLIQREVRFTSFSLLEIDSGYIGVKLINHLPFPIDSMVIGIGECGEIEFAGIIMPGAEAFDSLDIHGRTIHNQQHLELSGRTPGTGGQSVHIDTTVQTLDLVVILSSLKVGQFVGVMKKTKLRIEPREELIHLPQGLKAISLSTVQMDLEVKNGVNFPAELDSLILQGYDDGGSPLEVLTVPEDQKYIPPESETTIRFDSTNSNIVHFVNSLPRKIEASGSIIVGDSLYDGDANRSDSVLLSYHIWSPLELILAPQTIEGGTTRVEVGEETRDLVENRLMSGAIIARAENHLPLGASVTYYFDPDSTNLDSSASLIVPSPPDSLYLKPGHTSSSGEVDQPVISTLSIHLSHEDLQVFQDSLLFLRTKVEIPGTHGKPIKICPGDYLRITARLEVGVKVGGD